MTTERDQALRTLTEAWLGTAPGRRRPSDDRHRARRGAPGRAGPACSTSWPGWGTGVAHLVVGPAAAWPTSPTSCAPARRRRSACSTTRTAWPSAPTRCATRSWPGCCSPRCAASRPVPDRWRSCGTTTTPRCSTAATGATSWCSRGSTTTPRPDVDLMVALDGVRLQPRRRAARALGLGGEGPRGGAGAAGRPLGGLGAGPDLPARLLRVRRVARGRPAATSVPRRRALGTMTARMHLALDRAFQRRARAGGRLGRRGRGDHRRSPTRRCCEAPGRHRTGRSGSASPRRGCRSSAPTATSTWAARPGRTRAGW